MRKTHRDFYQSAKKIWDTVVSKEPISVTEVQLHLEFHKRLLNIFQAGNYYYFVFNIFETEIELVSPSIADVLGYSPEEVSVAFLMDKIHPDDKAYFLNFEYRVAEFFKALPFEKVKSYKVQYDYRIRSKTNHYVRLLHQAVQIEYDENNFYRTLVIETDITHIKPTGTPVFSLIGLDGEPSYYNIQDANVFKRSFDLFTKRERQVLKYIIEGYNSKQIADVLFISMHTVNTHRKHILNKANCKTPMDLISKAIGEGWI